MNEGPEKILEMCLGRYGQVHSYTDSGQVLTWYEPSEEPHKLTFKSWYKEPNLFRFDFESPHPYPPMRDKVMEHSYGYDGTVGYSFWRSYDGSMKKESMDGLDLTVAAATGISGGSIHTIAALLVPSISGVKLKDFTYTKIAATRESEAAGCYRLLGVHPSGGSREIWIEKTTFFLRKLASTEQNIPSEESRLKIQIDNELENGIFANPDNRPSA